MTWDIFQTSRQINPLRTHLIWKEYRVFKFEEFRILLILIWILNIKSISSLLWLLISWWLGPTTFLLWKIYGYVNLWGSWFVVLIFCFPSNHSLLYIFETKIVIKIVFFWPNIVEDCNKHALAGAFLDMYIGDVPVSMEAKQEIASNVACILKRWC